MLDNNKFYEEKKRARQRDRSWKMKSIIQEPTLEESE